MTRTKWSGAAIATTAIVASSMIAACSGGTTAANDGDGNTITVVSVDTQAIGDFAKQFEKDNPGVTVRVSTGGVDQYQQQIRTQLSSGTAPDVMYVWPGNGNPAANYVLAKAGYLLDLSDRPWAADQPDLIKSVSEYEGKTYSGLPGVNGIGAIYNQEAMDKAGLQPPATWSELITFCGAAKAKGTPAFALGNQTNWVTQLIDYALVATLVYAKTPDFDTQMEEGNVDFVTSPWLTAMQKYLEMEAAGCFQENSLGTSYEASQALVATGKTLGIVQGNWVVSLLKEQNPEGTFVMKALPATDDPNETLMAAAPGAGYGVNADSPNKELALKFVDYIMNKTGMNFYAEKMGGLPSFPDTDYDFDPTLNELSEYLAANKTVPFMDQHWPNAKVQQDHLTGLQDIFAGKSSPEDVLNKMDEDYAEGS